MKHPLSEDVIFCNFLNGGPYGCGRGRASSTTIGAGPCRQAGLHPGTPRRSTPALPTLGWGRGGPSNEKEKKTQPEGTQKSTLPVLRGRWFANWPYRSRLSMSILQRRCSSDEQRNNKIAIGGESSRSRFEAIPTSHNTGQETHEGRVFFSGKDALYKEHGHTKTRVTLEK